MLDNIFLWWNITLSWQWL